MPDCVSVSEKRYSSFGVWHAASETDLLPAQQDRNSVLDLHTASLKFALLVIGTNRSDKTFKTPKLNFLGFSHYPNSPTCAEPLNFTFF